MGNRALVIFGDSKVGVYLHWNGGPESVYPILDYMRSKECRMAEDPEYATARLVQIVGNFFGGTTSVGVQTVGDEMNTAWPFEADDPGDNGVYLVTVSGMRRFKHGHELSLDEVREEEREARLHPYNANPDPEQRILFAVAKKNDQHFNI